MIDRAKIIIMRGDNRNILLTLLFLSVTVWVAHFLHFLNFGLYEDDYAVISGVWRTADFLENARSAIMDWPEGRPIGYLSLGTFSYIGERIGGLHLIYVFGYLVVLTNAFLFYWILRKVGTQALAIIGAIIFCLYPADTTHSLLTHSLSLQISLTFILAATLLYLSGKRVLPYVILLGTILTYETPYFVFLAVPLLRAGWNKELLKEIFRHTLIMACITLVAVATRNFMGEARMEDMGTDLSNVLSKIMAGMVVGPAVSMLQFLNAPIRAWAWWNRELTIVSTAFFLVLAWILYTLVTRPSRTVEIAASVAMNGRSPLQTWQLLLAGTAMLMLGYVLSFTHYPPNASFGRGTSVHLASALGGSVIVASLGAWFLDSTRETRFRIVPVILLSMFLSLTLAYRVLIQSDFVRAWQNQRAFWTDVLDAVPDMTENTVIFVVNTRLPRTSFVVSNSWADPIILSQLFNFPAQWQNPPRVFVVKRSWQNELTRKGDSFAWMVPTAMVSAHKEDIPDHNFVLLEMENNRLVRRFGSINIDGLNLNFKELSPVIQLNYEKGPLYKYLIGHTG